MLDVKGKTLPCYFHWMKQIHEQPFHVSLKPILPDQVLDEDHLDDVNDCKAAVPEKYVRSTSKTPSPKTQGNVGRGETKMEPNLTPMTGGKEVTEEENATSQMEEKAGRQAIRGGAGGDGGDVVFHHSNLVIHRHIHWNVHLFALFLYCHKNTVFTTGPFTPIFILMQLIFNLMF